MSLPIIGKVLIPFSSLRDTAAPPLHVVLALVSLSARPLDTQGATQVGCKSRGAENTQASDAGVGDSPVDRGMVTSQSIRGW